MSAWKTARISEFCTTGTGGTPSRSNMERYYEGGTIPWVKSGELREVEINETEEYVTEAALRETNVKLVPAGALLLAMYGATVGRLGILGVSATTNQAVCHIVPDPKAAEVRYLFHALRNQVSTVIARGVGGAQPNISQGIVNDLMLPLPPLSEQRRMVSVLDKAETLLAQRRTAFAQLDSLTQSIFIELFGNQITNPKRWPERTVLEICEVRGGKRLPKGEAYSSKPTPFRYIRVTDLRAGSIDESALVYLKPEVQSKISRYIVNTDDVIISIAGSIGLIALVPPSLDGANLTENAAKLVPRDRNIYHSGFLASLLQTSFVQNQIRSHIGQVTIGKLALFRIERLLVNLPPLDLQREFAHRIATVEKLKVTQRASLTELHRLFASLQHRAFRGES